MTRRTAPPAEGEETHEAVMFRHGDGNVLAEVMPVLDAAQFSRMFGPAKALMFLAPDHPGSDGSPSAGLCFQMTPRRGHRG